MKKLKRPLMLCELLMRTPIIAGICIALTMLAAELLIYAAVIDDVSPIVLFSKTLGYFELIFITALFVSIGVLTASVARYWFGAKSAITLHMLPVDRAWMLIGWTLGGVFMILCVAVAQHTVIRVADIMLTERLAALYEEGEYFLEANSIWLAYVRVDFLHLILPRGLFEWLRSLLFLVGAPITSAAVTVEVISGRRLMPFIGGTAFLLVSYSMRITEAMPARVLVTIAALCITGGNAFRGYNVLKKGESL